MARLHELIAAHLPESEGPGMVVVAIETDRGPWVTALVASGYQVYAINPMSVSRYRERHSTSGAKSDSGDAWLLADLVRTDASRHRPVAGDSPAAEGGNAWIADLDLPDLNAAVRHLTLQDGSPASGSTKSMVASVLRRVFAGHARNGSFLRTLRQSCAPVGADRSVAAWSFRAFRRFFV
jgi:hypothetical protein